MPKISEVERGSLRHTVAPDGRLSLAYSDLSEIPDSVVSECGQSLLELDLSHNKIFDLRFLGDLPFIKSLILDDNHLTSQVKIPFCPELHTLWINDNRIQNLANLLSTVARSCPNLRIFSMMNNEAAPSYFNGGTYEQYLDYRYYVISCLPGLEYLDYSPVTPDEVKMAKKLFPASRLRFFRRRRSNKRIQRSTGV
ncbi:hypothetical protein RRG08_031231 [Elysia crispata]|uniref:Uncharacterized protein n=1 Tax=Elysia crispata TaxID=231223 RepID=A0AAE1AJE4_9GAST|nr:hypothetical protein RRG08_031231 [Elysia crispata]